MLLRGTERRIYAWSEPVDMRKSFNGLIALTRDVVREDPLSGDVFVFTNRAGNILKCLMWDRTGFMVVAKSADIVLRSSTRPIKINFLTGLFIDIAKLGYLSDIAVE